VRISEHAPSATVAELGVRRINQRILLLFEFYSRFVLLFKNCGIALDIDTKYIAYVNIKIPIGIY